MTSEQFKYLWNSNFPNTIPIQHYFKADYPHRWLRIHSLPKSKRYAYTEQEWEVLLQRQNEIITDVLGENVPLLLIKGDYSSDAFSTTNDDSILSQYSFVPLDPVDLYLLSPNDYEKEQIYFPKLAEIIWHPTQHDHLLKEIAENSMIAFFVSTDKKIIIAPYVGGIDLILKNQEAVSHYKIKYQKWLSDRKDGL